MLKRLILTLTVVLGIYFTLANRPIEHAPGILVAEQPSQTIEELATPFKHKTFHITPLANFSIKARVLSTERYRLGKEAVLSPIDLALGWGTMSDTATLDQLSISQGSRFYFWSAEQLSMPAAIITQHSANMHMVPADAYIKSRLLDLRIGDIVSIDGYLIRAESADGWHWQSSLTRNDSGNGACELVWVKDLTILTSTT
ncbi:MAG: hypothetical protein C0631_17670 [Sedimenticola sp.]|nr:MAG: hypothetical protein C0631_17670 [Sedimenticola sp.]